MQFGFVENASVHQIVWCVALRDRNDRLGNVHAIPHARLAAQPADVRRQSAAYPIARFKSREA